MVTTNASLTFTLKAAVALNAPLGVTIINKAHYSQVYGSGQSSVGFTTPSSVTQSINVDPTQNTTDTIVTFDGILTVTIPPSPTLPSTATRLVYTRLATPTVAAPLHYANLSFDLKLLDGADQEIVNPTFTPSLTIDIHYDADQLPFGTDENSMGLVFYNTGSGEWQSIKVIGRDANSNTLTVNIAHLTEFALVGCGRDTYLPIIMRDY
jgi:hypothetical protein